MTNILKKGLIIVGVYLIILIYLFYASNRIETLDKSDDKEIIPVAVNFNK